MRVRSMNQHLYLVVVTALVTALVGLGNPVFAGTVDLNASPPNLTTSVPSNILFTFDDSGSMQSNRVNDAPPWSTRNNGGLLSGVPDWDGGPWRCAAVIDVLPAYSLRCMMPPTWLRLRCRTFPIVS